jgi:hypothetical protein
MLSDPLYLGVPGVNLSPAIVPNTDVNLVAQFAAVAIGDGTSKRKATLDWMSIPDGGTEPVFDEALLQISHNETNENKPYKTTRTLKRIDVSRVDANGQTVTMSFYTVGVVPISSRFTEDDARRIEQMLALFTLYGPSTSSSDWTGTANDQTGLRLLRGEA